MGRQETPPFLIVRVACWSLAAESDQPTTIREKWSRTTAEDFFSDPESFLVCPIAPSSCAPFDRCLQKIRQPDGGRANRIDRATRARKAQVLLGFSIGRCPCGAPRSSRLSNLATFAGSQKMAWSGDGKDRGKGQGEAF